jgi:glycine/D-amino acid oxidase-like deaminating enzyme/nitrite reductase/ring-hydroxylating ferredoxin subunit
MNVNSENSRSVWMTAKVPQPSKLTSDLRTEILVIGGGIAGLSIAYELARAGHDVVVVDRGPIGGGMTARTSAHLSYEIDDFYYELREAVGDRKTRNYLESQKAAIDRIEEICAGERIACDFSRLDLFMFASDKKGRARLEKEYDVVKNIGFAGVEWADAPVAGPTRGCLRFPNQARFHPLRYLAGLSKAIKHQGGELYSGTPITSVEENTRGVVATTEEGHRVTAKAVIAATNTPFVNRLAVHTKQVPYRTYVLALEIRKSSSPDALIWDTDAPYHYVRSYTEEGKTLLIVGGEDHKSGEADDAKARFRRLEEWARARFPEVGKVRDTWSGQVYEPAGFVPFIGRSPGHKKVYLVTGDSGEGLTTGVVASLILPDVIAGRKNVWAQVYSPSRKSVEPSSVATYAKDLVGAAKHLAEHLFSGDADPDNIPPGKGAIVGGEREKVAAFRDERGKLHTMSAACTHLGCIVQWNSFERCWDCPCHGSQFSPKGEVLQGPAVRPLKTLRQTKQKPSQRRSTK